MTAREDLEAVIRRELTNACQRLSPSLTTRMNRAVTAILQAADVYGLAEYGITADRRAELERATRRTVNSPAGGVT